MLVVAKCCTPNKANKPVIILNNKTQSLQNFDPIKLSKIYVYTGNLEEIEDVMHVNTSPLPGPLI